MAQMVAEIDRLAKNSIKYYQLYFKFLTEMNEEVMDVAARNDLQNSELDLYFEDSKLYNNIILSDIKEKLKRVEKKKTEETKNRRERKNLQCLPENAYSVIVNYYDDHPENRMELEKLGCCRNLKNIHHFVAAYVRQI